MIRSVSEILSNISEEKDVKKRKDLLAQQSKNQGVIAMLQLAFDPNVKFQLPEGDPPYKPCEYLDQQGMLYNSVRKIAMFLDPNSKLPQLKKEVLFVGVLESLDPQDAKLLLAVKDKKMPYKGITKKLVAETFPNLIKG
jgi:hypothetical protein